MPDSMLLTIVHSWAFLQLVCKPFGERLSLHSLINKSLILIERVLFMYTSKADTVACKLTSSRSIVKRKFMRTACLRGYFWHRALMACTTTTCRKRRWVKNNSVSPCRRKIAQLYQFCVGLPSLEIMLLSFLFNKCSCRRYNPKNWKR